MKYEGGQVDMMQCLMADVGIGRESKWTQISDLATCFICYNKKYQRGTNLRKVENKLDFGHVCEFVS